MTLASDIRYAAEVLGTMSHLKATGCVFHVQPPEGFTIEESCRYDVAVVMRLKRMADRIDQNMDRLTK